MLTYNDCLGLSELTPEQVAALAKHEHLPEIVALEMGWSLSGTPGGRQRIRCMILDNIEDACRRGDTRTAARLGLALHHFVEAHLDLDRHGRVEPGQEGSGVQDVKAAPHDDGDRLQRTLGLDAALVRERVEVYLAAMLNRFGLDPASARERFPIQTQVAEMCCGACTETRRCRRFLAGLAGAEAPSAFCPNAPLLDGLRQRNVFVKASTHAGYGRECFTRGSCRDPG
jgi:hypothetical protein